MQKRIPENSVLIPDTAKQVFTGKVFDVFQWPQRLFDGSTTTFEMLRRADTASAVCVVDGQIIVIDEKQPNKKQKRNFPGGRVDPSDRTILAAAQREVLEETGYRFRQWRLVQVQQPYSKIEWFIHLFLAWEPEGRVSTKHDAGEKITIELVDFTDLKQQVLSRVGYLGESENLFDGVVSIEQLLQLPEFVGTEVDR